MFDIDQKLRALPEQSVTTQTLSALDALLPGPWENVRSIDVMIRRATGHEGPGMVAQLAEGVARQGAQEPERFERALWIFETVDTLDKVVAGAAVAGKVTGLLDGLGMLGGLGKLQALAPKPETTQAIDAALKLVAELLAFGTLQGMPKASVEGLAQFVIALDQYAKADLTRFGAWVVLDGLLPLGPSFMQRIIHTVQDASKAKLGGSSLFDALADRLPGDSSSQKQEFVTRALVATSDHVGRFVAAHGLTQEAVLAKLGHVAQLAGGAEVVAAALDATTHYFAHTGAQTVARAMCVRAHEQLQAQVWRSYVASLG